MTIRHVAVIDIGKTNAKLAVVDLDSLSEIAVRKTPNSVVADGLYPHFDCAGLWDFIVDSLGVFQRDTGIDAISVTTHGVAAALLDRDGALAMPILDYEFDGPDATAREYDAVRPPFAETGTPRLPLGLNLGAQLFWQSRTFPTEFARVATIVTYPQYWAYRLSGVLSNEVTSLGCHTDLWDPARKDYSTLVETMGWRELMAPLRSASDRLGPILPELAARTGLPPLTPVYCGIHDSNASLVPHLLSRQPPFTVVSTGTWVVAMAVGGSIDGLDSARDTLVNVDFRGDPVPSARYMGGREHAMLTEGLDDGWTPADVDTVLRRSILLLPSVQQGSGPFPHARGGWFAAARPSPPERRVAISFYLAMMTSVCLDLIGADGVTIVEGPFAGNRLFAAMLSAATGRATHANALTSTGTSIGAALLAKPDAAVAFADDSPIEHPGQAWTDYAARWRAEASNLLTSRKDRTRRL